MAGFKQTLAQRKARIDLLAEGIGEVARSKENTGGIVKIINALGGDTMMRVAHRFAKTEVGQLSVQDPDRLLRILQDRDYLAACPQGSLGRTYYEFVYQENLSADGLVDAVNEGSKLRPADGEIDPGAQAISARFRDQHDLWHVTTGYGRDVLGEMSILFFSFAQIHHPGFAFISLIAAGVAKLVDRDVPSYRILMEAYANGRTANWLIAEDWEAMFEMPLDEVRGQFGISRPKLYDRSADKAARLERRIQKLQGRIAGALPA
ncbi:MAG: Coq4 family protein [Alphaproteobacteria bacterium]